MTSRLIERLDQEIASCRDPLERECLKAERAGALARHGMIDEARFALTGLKSQLQRLRKNQLPTRLAARVALVEGLIDHFDSLAPEAALKFERCCKLAQEAADDALHSQALAWLATGSFNTSQIDAMIRQLTQAVRLAPRQHHAAWARIGLVLGDAYRFAGDDMRSQHWYGRARHAVGQEGDSSMMSAFLHNISAMRSASIGLDDAFGQGDVVQAGRALKEAESVGNYDGSSNSGALGAMVPVVRAQLLVVLERFDEALALYDAYLDKASAEGMAHREARFLADRAWCLARLGRSEEAWLAVLDTGTVITSLLDVDDLAAVHGRLARACSELGRSVAAREHQIKADAALTTYRAQQAHMRQALDAAFAHVV